MKAETMPAGAAPLICPKCGQKTGLFANEGTVYINVPWKCRKCKAEVIINFKAH